MGRTFCAKSNQLLMIIGEMLGYQKIAGAENFFSNLDQGVFYSLHQRLTPCIMVWWGSDFWGCRKNADFFAVFYWIATRQGGFIQQQLRNVH